MISYENLPQVYIQLFSLLQLAYGKQTSTSVDFSKFNWDGVFAEAKKQAIVGICYEGLCKIPSEYYPKSNLIINWLVLTESIRWRNDMLDFQSAQLTQFFVQGGFRSSVLKGQGYSMLYPGDRLRQSGDIDLLVKGNRGSIIGYCQKTRIINHISHKNLVIVDSPEAKVEIHFIPSWFYSPIKNHRFQQWTAANVDEIFRDQNIKGFSTPSLYFDRVFCLVHIYKHVFDEGIGLRQLLDYYCVLEASARDNPLWLEERGETMKILDSFGMSKFTSAVMFVLKVIVNIDDNILLCPPNEEKGRKLLISIIKGGNFGKYDKRNNHGKENYITRGLRNIRHNSNLLIDYPSEVLWSPIWKCWHWCWRKAKRYI